jgi:ribosomal protein L32
MKTSELLAMSLFLSASGERPFIVSPDPPIRPKKLKAVKVICPSCGNSFKTKKTLNKCDSCGTVFYRDILTKEEKQNENENTHCL